METRLSGRRRRSLGREGSEIVPGYRLLRRVGQGGSGEVWCAEGPGGLPVALKLIRLSDRLGDREHASLRILRSVRHPNLLAYFGAWTFDDLLVIGMELADRSLWDRCKEHVEGGLAGIPLGELLDALVEVARVIDFLHEPRHELDGKSGVAIFHRDIKPQNLMLQGGGVKVADFGLSSLAFPGATCAGNGLTLAYAAPETFRREVTHQSDQYSLAVTYCLLRGGRLPFPGPPALVMLGHLFQPPDLTMLPEMERPVIARALAKEPCERWSDCLSLVEALTCCRHAGSPDLIPLPLEETGDGSGTRRSPRLPECDSSEMSTGLLDPPCSDHSSVPDPESSSIGTVTSEDLDPSREQAVHLSTTLSELALGRHVTRLSNRASIPVLAAVTAILGFVAIGEPVVRRATNRQSASTAQPVNPSPGRSAAPSTAPAEQAARLPGSLRARFEDEFLLGPRWFHGARRGTSKSNDPADIRTTATLPGWVPELLGPAEQTETPSPAAMVRALDRTSTLDELKAHVLVWVGHATKWLERTQRRFHEELRSASTMLAACPAAGRAQGFAGSVETAMPRDRVGDLWSKPAVPEMSQFGASRPQTVPAEGTLRVNVRSGQSVVQLGPATAHDAAGQPLGTAMQIPYEWGYYQYSSPTRHGIAIAGIRVGRGRGIFSRRFDLARAH